MLTAMSGTEHDGREIPVAWQIEFDPAEDEFEAANAKLEDMDLEAGGYSTTITPFITIQCPGKVHRYG